MPSIFFLSLMNGAAWGGSEEIWYKTALYCVAGRWKVGCAAFEWKAKETQLTTLEKNGCHVYRIPNKGRSKKNIVEKVLYKFTKRQQVRFCRSLPFNEYDLVVVNLGGYEICTSQWRNFYTRLHKYALVFHNYNEDAIWSKDKATVLKGWIFNAKKNLFDAAKICSVLEKQLNTAIPNARVITNPITFSPPASPTPLSPLHESCYVFTMLAALDVSRKAQDNLITALSSLQWKERDWILYLYGEGHDRQKLDDLIRQMQLEDKVFLKGHTYNVQKVLEESHLVLQITHMDAMPISVVEAMAMSRPLVVSNIGDMPLWVHENENGWVSKDGSVEEINKALEKAWNKRNDWNKMGENSFSVFKERFPQSAEQYFLDQLNN
jgi:glycosyltransferase involved in cell wall biosynthesis